jgi:hypothetical protein
LGRVAGERLVAVDPDARVVEHRREPLAVTRTRARQQVAERGSAVELVGGAAGRLAGLREEPEPDGQLLSRPLVVVSTLVRAVGTASRRAGSIASPVTSSMP